MPESLSPTAARPSARPVKSCCRLYTTRERTGHVRRDALKGHGKTYEFHSYDGAGHAFMQVDRASYRPEAAVDAWQRIWAFFGR